MRSILLAAATLILTACGSGDDTGSLWKTGGAGGTDPGTNPGPGGTPSDIEGNGADPNADKNPNLDQRKINYGEALRTASLKLVGELPTMADINGLVNAADQKVFYQQKINDLLNDPRFAMRQIQWWRDTLKTGGGAKNGMPSFDTAATFAAEVVVKDRPYTDIFTAGSMTCPTYSGGTFTDANCGGAQPTAGILTDPGLMSQYYANMAFRRVRFVQETFVCSKFPAEFTQTPKSMGSGSYTSPWDFSSITGGNASRINFQDTSSVICANCHTTMNHQAELFAHFDDKGAYNAGAIMVKTPSAGNPTTKLEDWLPPSEKPAWRFGQPVTDLPSYGQAVAKDPDVLRCIVTREWNYAMSRGDVVNDLATVPPVVTDPFLTDFKTNGLKLKRLLLQIYTADDFVKF